MKRPSKIVPRDDLVDEVVKRVLKDQSVWLSASDGFGKSTIIQEVVDELEDRHDRLVIFCQESTQFKPLLLDIAEQLHEHGLFAWDQLGEDAGDMEWPKVFAKLDRVSVVEVAPVVIQSVEGNDIILVLDHLETVRATYQKFFARLFEVATVVSASDGFSNAQIKKLRSYARAVEVPKFTAEQAEELSDFLFQSYGINTVNEDSFKQHLLRAADGIPKKIRQLYEDAVSEGGLLGMDYIRGLRAQAGREYMNMGWLLLVLLAMPMVARIIAVGSGDRDAFIAFGILSAFGFVMRYLVYKGSRGTS